MTSSRANRVTFRALKYSSAARQPANGILVYFFLDQEIKLTAMPHQKSGKSIWPKREDLHLNPVR
jgi:hypothetical protein